MLWEIIIPPLRDVGHVTSAMKMRRAEKQTQTCDLLLTNNRVPNYLFLFNPGSAAISKKNAPARAEAFCVRHT
jgi:hypothetical protein